MHLVSVYFTIKQLLLSIHFKLFNRKSNKKDLNSFWSSMRYGVCQRKWTNQIEFLQLFRFGRLNKKPFLDRLVTGRTHYKRKLAPWGRNSFGLVILQNSTVFWVTSRWRNDKSRQFRSSNSGEAFESRQS